MSVVLGLVASTFAAGTRAQAQAPSQVRLVGRIHDETRRAVPGVEVIVEPHGVRTRSDSTGLFTIDVSPADSTLVFRRIGYRPLVVTLRPLPPARDTVPVELVTSAVELPEVVVSGAATKPLRYAGTNKYDGVFLRRKIGLGTLIDRDAVDRHFGEHTYELLQAVPGVHVYQSDPARIRFARCNAVEGAVQVFIDGVRQIPTVTPGPPPTGQSSGIAPTSGEAKPQGEEPVVEMLSRVNPSDVEMIEVFQGPSEIPAEFHYNGCAVVAIWTKWNK